ncbi:MAG: DUF4424 family protein [Azonexus sp.]
MSQAAAWESEAAVPLPAATGWLPDEVALVRAMVELAGDTVTLRYLFRNDGKRARSNVFAIYLPAYAWQGAASNYPGQHFPELRVAGGRPVLGQRLTMNALHDGRDITADLRRSGLAPEHVGLGEEALVVADAGDRQRYRKLLASGALHGSDGVYVPRWYARATHSWKQTYPPGETEMTIRYQARPGFAPMERGSPVLANYLRGHCANAADLGDSEDLLVKTYVIPFALEQLNLDRVVLDFAPAAVPGTRSFVCTNAHSGEAGRGMPAIANQEVHGQGGALSVLTISDR